MTISFPVLLLLVALIGIAVAARGGSSAGAGRIGAEPWWRHDHVPWGGADEPFHPRDRDLRRQAQDEVEARHRGGRAAGRRARMDERYGGDFGPGPPDGA